MRSTPRLVFAAAVLVLSATGCPKKKTDNADGGDAAPVAVVEAGPPASAPPANAAQVARFPNETPLADVAEDFDRDFNVRDAPPDGEIIAKLPKGTKVTQIARRERYYLITFDDPKDATRKLMGWVHEDAFKGAPPPKKLACKAPEVLLFADAQFCGRTCKADADCKAAEGETCAGKAKLVGANGLPGAETQTCMAKKTADAGAPAVADAGAAPTVADAGGAVADAGAAAPKDAGAAPAADAGAPKPGGPIVDPTGSACPAGYRLVSQTGKCHMLCAGNAPACGKLACSAKTFGDPAVCVQR
jgi:hypothetical protein